MMAMMTKMTKMIMIAINCESFPEGFEKQNAPGG